MEARRLWACDSVVESNAVRRRWQVLGCTCRSSWPHTQVGRSMAKVPYLGHGPSVENVRTAKKTNLNPLLGWKKKHVIINYPYVGTGGPLEIVVTGPAMPIQ